MIPIPSGVRVWLATGYTDMRCGFPSLALRVQEVLKHDPLGGHLFCFRGKRGDLVKIVWHDGQVRLSAGIEDSEDLIEDFARALSQVKA